MNMTTEQTSETFVFTSENLEWAKGQIAKYPEGRQASAVMPLLHQAQKQNGGWLPMSAIDYIADMLEMPKMRVYEVASFYSMYNLKPIGKHLIEVCTTTPCWLRGSDDVVSAIREELGIGLGETTEDGEFTVLEVECQGACVNAPVLVYEEGFYEDLDGKSTKEIIEAIKSGAKPARGSRVGRKSSEPAAGLTSLNVQGGDA